MGHGQWISDEEWSTWINADLPKDVYKLKDLDFMVPEAVGENLIPSSTGTRTLSL